MKSFEIFLKQSKYLSLCLMKMGGGGTPSCQSFLNFNTSQKEYKKEYLFWISLLLTHSVVRQLEYSLMPLSSWLSSSLSSLSFSRLDILTDISTIIKKRETWLFNQTKSTTLISCRVLVWWLGDSTPSRMNPVLEKNELMSDLFLFFLFLSLFVCLFGGGSRNQRENKK